jgi:hypothetical protein
MQKIKIIFIGLFCGYLFMGAQLSSEQESEFCTALKQMIAASQENFEPIKKDRKNGVIELYYTSSISLPTSLDTKIILSGENWYMSCKLQEKTDIKVINKSFTQISNILKNCLKNWRQTTVSNEKFNSVIFKDISDKECGTQLKLSVSENVAKVGYYKIMLTINP